MLSGYWNGGVGCSVETLAELIGDRGQHVGSIRRVLIAAPAKFAGRYRGLGLFASDRSE